MVSVTWVLLLLLWPALSWGTTFYVDNTRPNNTGNCTTPATACRTFDEPVIGALAKLNAGACGDSLLFHGDGQIHRVTGTTLHPTRSCPTNPQTIGAYNFSTKRPVISGSILLSNWTIQSGGDATFCATNDCTWRHTLAVNPGRMVLQNADDPPVVQRNGDVIVTPNEETDEVTALHAKWAESTTAATCPTIAKRHHFCWEAGVLYLRSRGNPATTFTDPGVEAVQSGTRLLEILDDSGYRIQDLELRQSGSAIIEVIADTANVSNITLSRLKVSYSSHRDNAAFGADGWGGNSGGREGIAFIARAPGGTRVQITGCVVEDSEIFQSGRDAIHFSHSGDIRCATNRTWIHHVFNHSSWYPVHNGHTQLAAGGLRTLTTDRLKLSDTCSGIMGNPAVVPATPASSVVHTYFLILRGVDTAGGQNADARMPLDHECGGASGQGLWTSTNTLPTTYRRGLIVGANTWERGSYVQHSGVTTVENVTVHATSIAGIDSIVTSGLAWTLRRSVLTEMPTGAAGQGPVVLATGATAAGDYNAFRNRAGTDVVGRIGTTNVSMQQWKDSAATTGDANSASLHATPLSGIYVDAVNLNFNPAANSPLINGAANNTSPCIGLCDIGAFEVPTISRGGTTAVNTWTFPVQTLVPPVVVSSSTCATPLVNGQPRTGTLTAVNSATVQVVVAGAAPAQGAELSVQFGAGCLKDSLNLGNDPNFTNQTLAQTVGVDNTITSPTPIDCAVADNDRDAILLRFANGGAPPMLPATNALGLTARLDGAVWATDGGTNRSGNDNFLTNQSTSALAGQSITLTYDPVVGDIRNTLGVESAAFTLTCANGVLPTGDICYVDAGCSNNITTYNPTTRACTGGTSRSYTSPTNALTGGVCLSGDTFIIRGGTYNDRINNSIPSGAGSWSGATVVKGAPGETAIIKPVGGVSPTFRIDNRSWVIIENLVFDSDLLDYVTPGCQGGLHFGTGTGLPLHHIRFQNNEVRNSRKSSLMSSDTQMEFIEILNNHIHHINVIPSSAKCSGAGTALPHGFYWHAQRTLIEGNTIHDIPGKGIQFYSASAQTMADNVFRRNTIFNTGENAIYIGAGNTGLQIYDNVMYNVANGIAVSCGNCGSKIYHNTIHNTTSTYCIRRTPTQAFSAGDAAVIKNNIVSQCTGSGAQFLPPGNFTGAPLFVDAANGDFHLQGGSSAKTGAACVAEVRLDFDNVVLPAPPSTLCPFGAYAFNTADTSPPLVSAVSPPGLIQAGGHTLPAGTPDLQRCVTTTETAVCKIGPSENQTFDAMAASGTMVATGNVHCLTHTGLTSGPTYTRYVRCRDSAGNETPPNLSGMTLPILLPSNGVRMQYQIGFQEPTVAECQVLDATPALVHCRLNLFGSAPLLPENNCTGWAGSLTTSGGAAAWTVTQCDRDAGGDGIDLVMDREMRAGNTATVTYTAGSDTPVTNAAGQELGAGTFPVNNGVTGKAPVLMACTVLNSTPTEIVWDFVANAPGAMTGVNCTSLSATKNSVTYTRTDCDPLPASVTQFRTVHTPAVVFGDIIDGIVTQGTPTPIRNADGIEVAPKPAPGLRCTNNVGAPPAAPLLTSMRVTTGEPTLVKVLMSAEAGPLLPANDCLGFSMTRDRGMGQGDQPWLILDCTLAPPTTMVLLMENALLYGDTFKGSYLTQGGAVPGRVRDQNDTQLAAFIAVDGFNLIDQPTETGTVEMVNIRCRAAEVPGSTFTGGETIRGATLNGPCELATEATVQVFVEIRCTPGAVSCAEQGYHVQACDNGACDSGGNLDHDAAGWYFLPNSHSAACAEHGACLGEDSTVMTQAPTTSCLSGEPRDAGVYLKNGAAGVVPTFGMGPGRCAQYVAVVALQPGLGVGGTVDFRMAASNGTRLATYPSGQPGRVQVTSQGAAQR